jgi:hypothetical protein
VSGVGEGGGGGGGWGGVEGRGGGEGGEGVKVTVCVLDTALDHRMHSRFHTTSER